MLGMQPHQGYMGSSEVLGSGAGSVSRGAKLDKVDRAEASELAGCSQRAARVQLARNAGPCPGEGWVGVGELLEVGALEALPPRMGPGEELQLRWLVPKLGRGSPKRWTGTTRVCPSDAKEP